MIADRVRAISPPKMEFAMAKLRLRVELNKGREGVPLNKFAHVVLELKKLVEDLGTQVGISPEKNVWFAHDFANGSGYFTNELAAVAEVEKLGRFNYFMRSLTDLTQDNGVLAPDLPASLIEQFFRVTEPLDYDEPIGFGVFDSDQQSEPTWLHVNKLRVAAARENTEFEATYYGTVLGTIHSWHKGSVPPFLNIRDLVSGELVKCTYTPGKHYSTITKLHQKEDSLIYVHGLVTVSLNNRSIDHIESDRFEVAPEYHDGDLKAFIGAVPNLTGGITTLQYINKIRNDAGRY